MATTNFKTIDEYIASFPADVQPVLQQIRQTIHEAVPEAQEKISYQMPTFTLNGKYFVYFSAWKKHIGFYGLPDPVLEAFKDQLAGHVGEKGAISFPLDKPMPLFLIRDFSKLAAEENRAKAQTKRAANAS